MSNFGTVECPYCGQQEDGTGDEIYHDGDQFIGVQCGKCGKTFDVFVEVKISFRSEKIEDEPEDFEKGVTY